MNVSINDIIKNLRDVQQEIDSLKEKLHKAENLKVFKYNMDFILANVNNNKLSDAEFRTLIRTIKQ